MRYPDVNRAITRLPPFHSLYLGFVIGHLLQEDNGPKTRSWSLFAYVYYLTGTILLPLRSTTSVMDRPAALILPAGFVTNTKEIYQEVASYPVIPLEQLWQYWHGNTTGARLSGRLPSLDRRGANPCSQYTPQPFESLSIPQLTASRTSGGMSWEATDAI